MSTSSWRTLKCERGCKRFSTSSQLRWIRPEDARLSDLLEVLTEQTELADYPHASRVEQQVLVYDWATLRHTAADSVTRRDVQDDEDRVDLEQLEREREAPAAVAEDPVRGERE